MKITNEKVKYALPINFTLALFIIHKSNHRVNSFNNQVHQRKMSVHLVVFIRPLILVMMIHSNNSMTIINLCWYNNSNNYRINKCKIKTIMNFHHSWFKKDNNKQISKHWPMLNKFNNNNIKYFNKMMVEY